MKQTDHMRIFLGNLLVTIGILLGISTGISLIMIDNPDTTDLKIPARPGAISERVDIRFFAMDPDHVAAGNLHRIKSDNFASLNSAGFTPVSAGFFAESGIRRLAPALRTLGVFDGRTLNLRALEQRKTYLDTASEFYGLRVIAIRALQTEPVQVDYSDPSSLTLLQDSLTVARTLKAKFFVLPVSVPKAAVYKLLTNLSSVFRNEKDIRLLLMNAPGDYADADSVLSLRDSLRYSGVTAGVALDVSVLLKSAGGILPAAKLESIGKSGGIFMLYASFYDRLNDSLGQGRRSVHLPYTRGNTAELMQQLNFLADLYRISEIGKDADASLVADFPRRRAFPLLHYLAYPLAEYLGLRTDKDGATDDEIRSSVKAMQATLSLRIPAGADR